jgi:hypothetical protein
MNSDTYIKVMVVKNKMQLPTVKSATKAENKKIIIVTTYIEGNLSHWNTCLHP